MQTPDHPREESIEARKERLLPILRESYEQNTPLRVTRKREGHENETLDGLVVWGMNEDGPEFCVLEADGGPSQSATMLWSEIINIEK